MSVTLPWCISLRFWDCEMFSCTSPLSFQKCGLCRSAPSAKNIIITKCFSDKGYTQHKYTYVRQIRRHQIVKGFGTYSIYLYSAVDLIWAFKVLFTVSIYQYLAQGYFNRLEDPGIEPFCYQSHCCPNIALKTLLWLKELPESCLLLGKIFTSIHWGTLGGCTDCNNNPVNNFLSLMGDYGHIMNLLIIYFYQRSKIVTADDIISEPTPLIERALMLDKPAQAAVLFLIYVSIFHCGGKRELSSL